LIDHIASIVGAITGCISILGLVYFLGFWRGRVDTTLNEFGDCLTHYPPAEMWTMVKTLWDIYVVSALHHRPDLADHGSGYRLNREGEDLIPDYMKPLLQRIPRNTCHHELIATGYLVVKHIGLELIDKMAAEKKLSMQESIAILSTWLDCHSLEKLPSNIPDSLSKTP